jgi:hypothetical protein
MAPLDEMALANMIDVPAPMAQSEHLAKASDFVLFEATTFDPSVKEFPFTDILANDSVCQGCKRRSDVASAWEYFKDGNKDVLIDGKVVEIFGCRRVCLNCPLMTEQIVSQED